MPDFVSPTMTLMLWGLIGYLLGSVPFGMIWARVFALGNLRDIGSGNIGATNVLRTGSKKAAFLTLLFDGGKGAVAVIAARSLTGAEDAVQIAALAAFIGHCFPIWLRFQGGKGVATLLGILLALHWPAGIAACLTWLLVAVVMRFSSLSALLAASFAPIYMVFLGYFAGFFLSILLALLIYWRHWGNIMRLRAGTEPKIGKK